MALHQIARRFRSACLSSLPRISSVTETVEGAGSGIAELGAEPNFPLAFVSSPWRAPAHSAPSEEARGHHLCREPHRKPRRFREIGIVVGGRQETGKALLDMDAPFAHQVIEERCEMIFGGEFQKKIEPE